MSDTPWVALAALAAIFLLPFVPEWLFEGPRKVKHWPGQHICGRCEGPWTDGHACAPSDTSAALATLHRLDRHPALERRPSGGDRPPDSHLDPE